MWVAPIVKQANLIWEYLNKATRTCWIRKSETYREITLPSYFAGGREGRILVRSADQPDSLRGEGLDGVVLDEAAFMSRRTWQNVIRPALSDRSGWAMFTTTPNGFNWLKDLFDAAPRLKGWARWQGPTWENPTIPYEDLLEAFETLPRLAWKQEYGAEFVQQEGAEWPAEYFDQRIWFENWPRDYNAKLITCDPSKGSGDRPRKREGAQTLTADYCAFILSQHDEQDVFWCEADIERRDAHQIAEHAVVLCKSFMPHAVGFETNMFQSLIKHRFQELCWQHHVDVNVWGMDNSVKKQIRILALTPLLATGRIRIKRNLGGILLVDMLRSFPLPSVHDDGPDALEMNVRLYRDLTRAA